MADKQFPGEPVPFPSVQQYYLPPALFKLRQQVGKEYTVCWLLVALAAIASWTIGPTIAAIIGIVIAAFTESTPFSAYDPFLSPVNRTIFFGSDPVSAAVNISSLVFPVAVGFWAHQIFKSTKERTIRDLTRGNMALMLADEQFGKIIEDAVHSKYRMVLGKVQLGGNLISKVNHFAYYYKFYYRMSFGPSELKVSSVSAESCWLEGCALWACNGCPVIMIAIALRIILVRPKILGIKTAVAEYLEGRHDHLLEQHTVRSAH